MMVKRWLNIFLCIWLINSVTYFHPHNPFEANGESGCGLHACIKINTWLDVVKHISAEEHDEDTPFHEHRIDSQKRYVNSRANLFGNFLPYLPSSLSFKSPKLALLKTVGNYSIGVAKLPTYYNFLFRLSPF
ncbi:hypothetical protein MUY27_15230 [Mucilaginibacter sp. RS28]|uniref:Uncharacterized protein n=1 Tax=Mucilaginibacter straminoryzae TaxID=2932774 RepID=A0A9X1X674_9SPHI|nr:hypothetical protein [Mucilaginibacter straminoryzae]MCJ8211070.1 hypothetical protein [Mucilaginibacter straminoryzae]